MDDSPEKLSGQRITRRQEEVLMELWAEPSLSLEAALERRNLKAGWVRKWMADQEFQGYWADIRRWRLATVRMQIEQGLIKTAERLLAAAEGNGPFPLDGGSPREAGGTCRVVASAKTDGGGGTAPRTGHAQADSKGDCALPTPSDPGCAGPTSPIPTGPLVKGEGLKAEGATAPGGSASPVPSTSLRAGDGEGLNAEAPAGQSSPGDLVTLGHQLLAAAAALEGAVQAEQVSPIRDFGWCETLGSPGRPIPTEQQPFAADPRTGRAVDPKELRRAARQRSARLEEELADCTDEEPAGEPGKLVWNEEEEWETALGLQVHYQMKRREYIVRMACLAAGDLRKAAEMGEKLLRGRWRNVQLLLKRDMQYLLLESFEDPWDEWDYSGTVAERARRAMERARNDENEQARNWLHRMSMEARSDWPFDPVAN